MFPMHLTLARGALALLALAAVSATAQKPATPSGTPAAAPAAAKTAAPAPDAAAVRTLVEQRLPGMDIRSIVKTDVLGL